MQIALGYSISWQSSFFHASGLGYHVDHSATRLQQLRLLRVFPAIGLDAIRCWDLPLHYACTVPTTCIQLNTALD
ncbi:hypothetical protein CO701_15385 [Citrobacter werkmanii]|nr:hypothetical protein CO701_15385 [Citrobacter werkmanii]QCA19341.1 hypothetical protein E5284_16385 [Citrobacter freundii]RFU92867.1 hypothetical protein DZA29_05890 [Citrobacter gillenii]